MTRELELSPRNGVASGTVARRARRRAFTLIEVLIALAIVLALSALIGVAVFSQRDKAEVQLAQTELNTLENAINMFRLDYNRVPMEEEGLEVLWNREALDPDADQDAWTKYVEKPMTTDRWGNEWGYRAESEYGADFDLWSNGPDGEPETEDDITSWEGLEGGEGGMGGDFMPPPPGGGGTGP